MLLTNASIWPMDREPISNGFILVEHGRIVSIGDMAEVPRAGEGQEVVNLQGKQIVPGFVDAHCHLGLQESALGAEGDDINEDTDPVTPHLRAVDGINPLDPAFAEARAAGITCAVVAPGSSNPVAGAICALKTNGRWVDEMAVKQPLAMKFSLGENPKMVYGSRTQSPFTRMGTVAMIREQLALASRYSLDLHRSEAEEEEPPEFDAKCEALLPVIKGEIAAHFHAHKAYDILTALRIAKEFSLRLTIVHGTEAHLVADILAQENVSVVCGPFLSTRTKPELSALSVENLVKLQEAGVSYAISTDYPELPMDCLAMSASVARAGGLSGQDAVYAITLGAAKAVELDHRVGSITPGKDADLLVYSRNLLDVGVRPDMVFINGVWVK